VTTRRARALPTGTFGTGLMVAMLIVFASPASAHDPAGYYTSTKWPAAPVQTNEPYWLASGVPFLARVEASIVNGANQWNSLNEPVRFAHQGWSNQSIISFPNCPSNTNSYVFQRDIGSNLAETYTCGNPVNSFIMTFDSNPPQPWYSDSGSPPANSYDRWSTSSHEFGHATGWVVHWPDTSSRCLVDANRLTMCSSVPQGTSMMRTLGDHDIHTFQAAY